MAEKDEIQRIEYGEKTTETTNNVEITYIQQEKDAVDELQEYVDACNDMSKQEMHTYTIAGIEYEEATQEEMLQSMAENKIGFFADDPETDEAYKDLLKNPEHIFIDFDYCSGGLWAMFDSGHGLCIEGCASNYGISEKLEKAICAWNDLFDDMICVKGQPRNKDYYNVRKDVADAMKPAGLLLAKYLREELPPDTKVSYCYYLSGEGETFENSHEYIEPDGEKP